jgi:hypothetical protein
MAYGIKYRLSWCAPDGTPLRYEILKNGYSGAVSDVEGSGNPFNIKKLNDDGKSGTIITTEAVIEIREDANFSVDDIYTSDEREYQVKYYKNNVLDWVGYLLPDYFSKEVSGYPVLKLSAIDQLGMLKDKPYQNNNGKPFQERMSFLRLLVNCLKHTGIDLNLKVVADFTCDEWDPIDPIEPYRQQHFLTDTYHESSRFSDGKGNVVSVHDALETTLNLINAQIYIENGYFWVVNRRQRELGIGDVFTYDLQGNQIGLSTPYEPESVNFDLLGVGGTQEIVPPSAATQVYSEHGPSFPMPKNRDFQGYNAGKYPNWTNSNVAGFPPHNEYRIEDTFVDVYKYDSNGGIHTQGVTSIARPWIKSWLNIHEQLFYKVQPHMESDPINITGARSISFSIGLKGHYNDTVIAVLALRSYTAVGHELTKTYFMNARGDWMEQKHQDLTENFLSFTFDKPEGRTSTTPDAISGEFPISSNGLPQINRNEATLELSVLIYGHTKGEDPEKYMMTIESLTINMDYPEEPSGILFSLIRNGHFTKKSEPRLTLFSDKIVSGEGGGRFLAVTRTITSNLITRSGKLAENWTARY